MSFQLKLPILSNDFALAEYNMNFPSPSPLYFGRFQNEKNLPMVYVETRVCNFNFLNDLAEIDQDLSSINIQHEQVFPSFKPTKTKRINCIVLRLSKVIKGLIVSLT